MYTKLLLTGAILNSDLAGSIPYAKLVLANSIIGTDINASAAIPHTKMAALIASMIPVTDAGGFIISSGVPAAKAAYLANVTSDVQAQLSAVNKHITTVNPTTITSGAVLVAADMADIIIADTTLAPFQITLPRISTLTD